MDRAGAIAEIEWYRNLLDRRLRDWGRHLKREARERLLSKIERVQECDNLQFKQYDEGYYIGQLDEDGLRHGYGIYTRTSDKKDRWMMQAGEWTEERAVGIHTLYDADCPEKHHYLAAIHFKGNRRKERGLVGVKLSERGIDTRPRKYRRWEGFSWSTLIVGAIFIYILTLVFIRNAKICLIVVAIIAALYILGCIRGRD
jgi:hypothetical protein